LRPRRLALMNLYLNGLEPEITFGDSIYEVPSARRFDVVLTNPPFGTKGANQVPEREDFVIATSNVRFRRPFVAATYSGRKQVRPAYIARK
jgi:type I restriction enzyme M protein